MPHFIRANMTTGNVRLFPLSPERKALGGRALVSQVLYTEMPPSADPLGAGNVLVLAAGMFAGQPLSCCDELVIGAKSPETAQLASVRFMSRAARMMAGMSIPFGIFEGRPVDGRQYVLHMEHGRASLLPVENLVPTSALAGAFALHDALHERFGRNTCIISVGRAAFSASPAAALLVSGSEDGSIKTIPAHGLASVMAAKGLRAFVLNGNPSTERVSPAGKALCRNASGLLRCARQQTDLQETPFGRASLCRYCLDRQYVADGGWASVCADLGLLPSALASPDISGLETSELYRVLSDLMEARSPTMPDSPLHDLLPAPHLLAAYDTVGLCPLAVQPDSHTRMLDLMAALAKASCGMDWDAERLLRSGAEMLERERAFNDWALSPRNA